MCIIISNATAKSVNSIKPIVGKFNIVDLSKDIELEDRYFEREELLDLLSEYEEMKDLLGSFNSPKSFISTVECSDIACRGILSAQDLVELFHGVSEDIISYLKYLLECFDDSDKLQEAISKGLIESYK